MQDIQPIGALSRVVLGTLMKQPWVPYEYKCLLFCFATDPTEDEVHHAFCRFSCNRHINIFQMWIWLDFSMIDKGAFPMFNCQFMRNTSTYTLSLSIQVWFLFDFSKMSSWFHVASSLSNSLVYNGFSSCHINGPPWLLRFCRMRWSLGESRSSSCPRA